MPPSMSCSHFDRHASLISPAPTHVFAADSRAALVCCAVLCYAVPLALHATFFILAMGLMGPLTAILQTMDHLNIFFAKFYQSRTLYCVLPLAEAWQHLSSVLPSSSLPPHLHTHAFLLCAVLCCAPAGACDPCRLLYPRDGPHGAPHSHPTDNGLPKHLLREVLPLAHTVHRLQHLQPGCAGDPVQVG